jgi:hypothetical protein
MSSEGSKQVPDRLRPAHFVLYGLATGLAAFGCTALFSRLWYGSWDITEHAVSLAVLGVLAVMAGVVSGRVLAWLLSLVALVRIERHAAVTASQRLTDITSSSGADATTAKPGRCQSAPHRFHRR